MENVSAIAKDLGEYNSHADVIRLENSELGIVGFIAIHSLREAAPSLGATRLWRYETEQEALQDALRLSRLMSHKSVFAGLPYGGAKGVLMAPGRPVPRQELFHWYAEQINSLKGAFITGSDVGVQDADVSLMRHYSPYIIGSNVPAAYYTALGVLHGIETALETLRGSSAIYGRTFAIQGLGKTGFELVKQLYEKGARITVSDIDPKKVEEAKRHFPRIASVNTDEIFSQKVDVFSPCALYYSINSVTAPRLQCAAIVGSANNQMENKEIESFVYNRGILYAVDYIVNNGGFISVADQFEYGTHDDTRIKEKLLITKAKLKDVLDAGASKSISYGMIADRVVATALNL